jgi:hypothetical protein
MLDGREAKPPVCHSPSCSVPFNDSVSLRFLVLASIKLPRLFQDPSVSILRLRLKSVSKLGTFRDLAEASTLQFVARHTSIPVLKIYRSFTRKNKTYIMMQKIKWKMVAVMWESLSDESKARILLQLKEMIDEMQMIPSSSNRIASVDGGS